jgi:26S proteasome regulatory subunit N7
MLPVPLRFRSELFSYTDCVSYAVLTSLISLERVPLKSRVVDSPEIRSVIGHVPALETCLNALYDCKYKDFFKVRQAWKRRGGLRMRC